MWFCCQSPTHLDKDTIEIGIEEEEDESDSDDNSSEIARANKIEHEKRVLKRAVKKFLNEAQTNGVHGCSAYCNSMKAPELVVFWLKDKYWRIYLDFEGSLSQSFSTENIQSVIVKSDILARFSAMSSIYPTPHCVGLEFTDGRVLIMLLPDEEMQNKFLRVFCVLKYVRELGPKLRRQAVSENVERRLSLGSSKIAKKVPENNDYGTKNLIVLTPTKKDSSSSKKKKKRKREGSFLESVVMKNDDAIVTATTTTTPIMS